MATTALRERSASEIQGVRVVGFDVSGNRTWGMRGDVDAYRRFVLDGGFDVVMNYAAQQWTTDALLDILPQINAAKVLVPCGFSGLLDPSYRAYFEAMPAWLAAYDACVYLSDSYRDTVFARGHGLANGCLIPNGASEDEFDVPLTGDIRARLGLKPGEFFVLTVGSHTGIKGHAEAVRMLETSALKNAALVIAGNSFGGGCTRTCMLKARIFPWKPSWRWRGLRLISVDLDRKATVEAFRGADVFLFPSNMECSPLVLFEAAAAGLPFLSSDVGNAMEIAQWTGGGEVMKTATDERGFSRPSVSDGADRLSELWLYTNRRRAYSESGRRAWKDRFTWDRIVGEYERLYSGLAR